MPLQVCGHQSADVVAVGLRRLLGGLPIAVMQRGHQFQHTQRRRRRTGWAAVAHTLPPAAM